MPSIPPWTGLDQSTDQDWTDQDWSLPVLVLSRAILEILRPVLVPVLSKTVKRPDWTRLLSSKHNTMVPRVNERLDNDGHGIVKHPSPGNPSGIETEIRAFQVHCW